MAAAAHDHVYGVVTRMSKIPDTADTDNTSFFKVSKCFRTYYCKTEGFVHLNHGVGDYMESKPFHTFRELDKGGKEEYKDVTWGLRLYPRGDSEENKGHVSIFLELQKNKGGKNIRAHYNFTIGKNPDKMVEIVKGPLNSVFASNKTCLGYAKFIEHDKISQYEDKLGVVWIACNLEHSIPRCDVVATSPPSAMAVPPPQVERAMAMSDLLKMYTDGSLTDAVVEVEDRRINVHKVVLAARSSVFKKLFMGEFAEASTNVIEITDIDKTACEIMLSYMYGDCKLLKQLSLETVKQLLHAADKYDVQGLKLRCEQLLCCAISGETVVDLLVIGDRYRAERLKKKCAEYVMLFRKKVTHSETWDTMSKQFPDLVNECIKSD